MSKALPLAPTPALVRPRARSTSSGETLPLETIAAELLLQPDCRRIEIAGGPGAGKTTALRHLAATLPPLPPAVFLDDPPAGEVEVLAQKQVVFFTSREPQPADVRLGLAPWTDDDLIELLLAVAPQRCGDVMRRVQAAPERGLLQGNPALWRLVLDELLGDAALTNPREAVAQALTKLCGTKQERRLAAEFCLAILTGDEGEALRKIRQICPDDSSYGRFGPLRHSFVQRLLAGQKAATLLKSGGAFPALRRDLPQPLIDELAIWVQGDAAIGAQLQKILAGRDYGEHAQAASILFAADPRWRPAQDRLAILARGSFPRAQWARLRLAIKDRRPSDLSGANLIEANLTQARLDQVRLLGAVLARAQLDKAALAGADAREADFSGANLTAVDAPRALLGRADLRGAHCDEAALTNADLDGADLRGARFRGADLTGATLLACQVEEADFTGANLHGCHLQRLVLREAILDGAALEEAHLDECDLEGVSLLAANFRGACLRNALLTASNLLGADFRRADLRGAGLADIHWEDADLRDADLRGCSFHMGSSRSGLVDSPYPGHGSKTGFYTDDYYDQDYKAPEEIRKANLCGADLRGAHLEGVDFYLVDLRGARFDAVHADHLARCGAILYDRCA